MSLAPDEPNEPALPGRSVAILFAEPDRSLAGAFARLLADLRRDGLVSTWTEQAYAQEDTRLGVPSADVIVLLMSADLLANLGDLPDIVQAANVGALIVPVMLRPCAVGGSGLERFLRLPRNGRAVTGWRHPDDAWEDVLVGLRERLDRRTAPGVSPSGRVIRFAAEHLTVFERASLDASPGINIFIGQNGSGKSHALKAMYALLRAPADEVDLESKLRAVFKGDLLRRPAPRDTRTALDLQTEGGRVSLTLHHAGDKIRDRVLDIERSRAIFLPSREALSMYEGFTSAYERRELSFDETYYDLCKELGALPLRDKAIGALRPILDTLEAALGGTVSLAGTRFLVRSPIGEVEAHMVAEGMRKIASLAYLIRNGALLEHSVLFWDEPEANLNPKLVTVIARVLRDLGARGVQIFLATHDCLLARELSLGAEYRTEPDVDVRFFSFYRDSAEGPVRIEAASTFAALEHNPILDEYKAHYEREQALFYAPDRDPEEAA